jgi:hypothetical protein
VFLTLTDTLQLGVPEVVLLLLLLWELPLLLLLLLLLLLQLLVVVVSRLLLVVADPLLLLPLLLLLLLLLQLLLLLLLSHPTLLPQQQQQLQLQPLPLFTITPPPSLLMHRFMECAGLTYKSGSSSLGPLVPKDVVLLAPLAEATLQPQQPSAAVAPGPVAVAVKGPSCIELADAAANCPALLAAGLLTPLPSPQKPLKPCLMYCSSDLTKPFPPFDT